MATLDETAAGVPPAVRHFRGIPRHPYAPPAFRASSAGWAGLRRSVSQALDQRRLFMLLPPAAIAGLASYATAGSSPSPWAMMGVAAALSLGLAVSVRSIVALRLLLLFGSFWLGFCLLELHGSISGTTMLARPVYGQYQAQVDEVLSETGDERRVIVSAITPVGDAAAIGVRRARLFIRDGPELARGDVIRAPLRFYQVPGPVLPGGFDSQFHGYFSGIGAYATSTGEVEIIAPGDAGSASRLIDAVRDGIAGRVDLALAQPAAGVARAIINGDQSAVDDEAREVMATAGLAHVLSISGLHLTLVAGGVFSALRMGLALCGGIARRISIKCAAAFGGIAAALLYFSISGGNVAALRSTIMIVLVFGAVIFGRRALTMRNVAIAAMWVVIADPASVFRPSFQLSFAAVIALVGAFELTHGRKQRERDRSQLMRVVVYFGGLAGTSLVAGAATLLFSAYHFQQTSPLGVVGNLVALPLVAFVMMPAALIAVMLMPLGFEWLPMQLMGWSVERMLDVGKIVAGLSVGLDASPLLTPAALVVGLLALAWFAFLQDRYRLVGPALAVPAVLLFAMDSRPDVLVADTTQAVALLTEDKLALVVGRLDSFAVEVWSETYGTIAAAAPGTARCDSVGCIGAGAAGFTVAVIKDPAGFGEDCGKVDLVVTRLRAPSYCGATALVIDAEDLALRGTHWLRWNPGGREFDIRLALPDVNRPWRASPQ